MLSNVVMSGELQTITCNICFFLFCLFVYVGGKTPDPSALKNVRTYKDIVQEQDLQRDQVCYTCSKTNLSVK